MTNGCGPQWMEKFSPTRKLKALVAKYFLGWFFHASCNRHDEGYAIGGNWVRKIYCDVRFFAAMIDDAGRLGKVYKQLPALLIAHIYFMLVLIFGWFSFNYQ